MAESKRSSRKASKGSKRDAPERLTTMDLALNAIGAFVGAPVMFVLAVLLFMGTFGTNLNQHLFLGAVCILIGLFLVLLCGLRVWEHVKARRRFEELLEGERKSALMQNLDEVTSLARALGPPYRRRLEGRLDELGVKR
jgi:Na+/melibiose symporter-like transporter